MLVLIWFFINVVFKEVSICLWCLFDVILIKLIMIILFRLCRCSWWVMVWVVLILVLKMVFLRLWWLINVFVLMLIVVMVLVWLMIRYFFDLSFILCLRECWILFFVLYMLKMGLLLWYSFNLVVSLGIYLEVNFLRFLNFCCELMRILVSLVLIKLCKMCCVRLSLLYSIEWFLYLLCCLIIFDYKCLRNVVFWVNFFLFVFFVVVWIMNLLCLL